MVSSLLPIIFAYFLGGVVLPGHVVHVSHHVSTTAPDSTNPKKPRNKKCSLLPDNQKMLRFWKFYITKSVTHKLRHRSLLGYFHDFHLIGSCHRPAPWNIKWTWMGIGMRNLDLKLKHGWTYWFSIPTPHLIDRQGKHVGLRSCHKAINGYKWDIVGLKTVVSITATSKSAHNQTHSTNTQDEFMWIQCPCSNVAHCKKLSNRSQVKPSLIYPQKKQLHHVVNVWTWLKISP